MLICHRIYRILSLVLRDMYSIRPVSIGEQCEFAAKYTRVLEEWRNDIPKFLNADSDGSTPLIPIFQRQRDVLNLAYWHALVLVHRPLFLRNFTNIQHSDQEASSDRAQIKENIGHGLNAAMHIVDKVNAMFCSGLMFRSFWVSYPMY